MRRLRHWVVVLAFLKVLGLPVSGQSLPNWLEERGVPKAPDSGIRDDGGFFDRSPGAAKRISDQFRKLEADHGFRILLMVEPILIGLSTPEWAAQLQQAWLPEGDGLVVVFESDGRNLGFGRDLGSELTEETEGRVPTHETAAILTRARKATPANLPPDAHLEALMGNLVKEFDSYFDRREAPPPAGRALRLGLLIAGGLTLLALAATAIAALVRLPSMAGSRSFRFPEVERPERLGAPGGGGNVTVRRFSVK